MRRPRPLEAAGYPPATPQSAFAATIPPIIITTGLQPRQGTALGESIRESHARTTRCRRAPCATRARARRELRASGDPIDEIEATFDRPLVANLREAPIRATEAPSCTSVLDAAPYSLAAVDLSVETQDQESQRLGHKIDELLRSELTQHWYPHAVNRGRGGFHQTMAGDWSLRPDEDIFLVYQARMTWTAAAFAGYSAAHRREFEGYARHGIEFLDRVMRDTKFGGFHWVLGPEGRLDPARGGEKHVYGMAFVIYAASAVWELTGDEQSQKVARDAFDWLEQHAHDAKYGGYWEALRRDGTPIVEWSPDAPIARRLDRLGVYYGFKTMNVAHSYARGSQRTLQGR